MYQDMGCAGLFLAMGVGLLCGFEWGLVTGGALWFLSSMLAFVIEQGKKR